MMIEGIWRRVDEYERAITIRAVAAIALRNVTSYIDYKIVVLKVAEVAWDKDFRKHVISCIQKYNGSKDRFCCILDSLGLPMLRKKYCD